MTRNKEGKVNMRLWMQRALMLMYAVGVLWWVSITLHGMRGTFENYIWEAPMILIPISAGIYSFLIAKQNQKNSLALRWLSIGLIVWGLGTLLFLIYNVFLHIEVPYPSLADVLYISAFVFLLIGLVNLRIPGIRGSARETLRVALGLMLSYCIVIAMYAIVLAGNQLYFSFSVDTFCKLIYPMFDIVFFVLGARVVYAILYSPRLHSRALKILVLSILLNYFGDMSFSITTQNNAYFVADWVDLIFLTVFFLMSYAVISYEE